MLTHMPMSEPTALLVPIQMPTPMPTTKDSAIPIRKACNVMLAASMNVSEGTTSPIAMIEEENGGISDTSSSRPTNSHSTNHTSSENAMGIRRPPSSMSFLQVVLQLGPG